MSPSLNSSNAAPTSSQAPPSSSSSWTPKPIRILFSHFPLQTLPANRLPSRSLSPSARTKNTLFLFTTAPPDNNHSSRIPSFNPTCLKWQTFLLMRGIEFRTRHSNNHASPSGSLPFLIVGGEKNSSRDLNSKEKKQPTLSASSSTIPASSLQSWALSQTHHTQEKDESASLQESAFLSLLDHRLRPAWLHSFYLTQNLYTLAAPLYIHTATSSPLVRSWQTVQLRAAALTEVRKVYPLVGAKQKDVDVLYVGAERALEALDTALGDGEWFFDAAEPGMLDAAVFAYVCLLLDDGLGVDVGGKWDGGEDGQRLRALAARFQRLRGHRERILKAYFN